MTKNWTKVLPEERLMPYLDQTRMTIRIWLNASEADRG